MASHFCQRGDPCLTQQLSYITLGANDFAANVRLKLHVPMTITRRAIAEEFARLGAHVWICARSSEDLEKCLAEFASATWSGSIHGSVCDASVAEDRKQLMAQVTHHFSSKLDILVKKISSPTCA